jgi:hypothetical protein
MILESAHEFLKANDMSTDSLAICFLLFARYFFKRLYETTLAHQILRSKYSEFSYRCEKFRRVTPLGFGLTEKFMPAALLSVPLCMFPPENPYQEAIQFFKLLPYQICPIDFCMILHNALTSVQRVASGFSLEDASAKGTVPDRGQHLLSTSELVDVATVIFLIGNPMPVIALIQVFERYIQGLEMMSQFEFAFASISTVIQRIREVSVEEFLQEAAADDEI